MRGAEACDTFAAWITASCRDPRFRDAPPLPARAWARTAIDDEVIRYGRGDRVLASFVANVWSQRFRCANCHAAAGGRNPAIVREHGEDVTWLKPDPLATMRHLIQMDLVNLAAPARSRLLRKAIGEVDHGGGTNMKVGDAGYLALARWIDDYARVVQGRYARAADLPPGPAWFGTEIWLRIKEAPADWQGRLVRMTVYATDGHGGFRAAPAAATVTPVETHKPWGVMAHMTLYLALTPAARTAAAVTAPGLPAGRYLVKVTAVPATSDDPLTAAGEGLGSVDVDAAWKPGFPNALEIAAAALRAAGERIATKTDT